MPDMTTPENAATIAAPIKRPHDALALFASKLFYAAGMDDEKANSVAELLVFTDMMGRATHGLAQCAAYLDELKKGGMRATGVPETVRDMGATLV